MTLRCLFPPISFQLALALLLVFGGSAHAQTVPRIFFAEAPALLIQIDGEPVYRQVERTTLDRVVNSQAVIVRDPAGIHYLKVLDGWMEAYGLRGQWSVCRRLAAGVQRRRAERCWIGGGSCRIVEIVRRPGMNASG
jgi:hypothetical protein